MTPRHFLDLADFTGAELRLLLDEAKKMKAARGTAKAAAFQPLRGKTVALIFEQPSMRTRVSFNVGVTDLGGEPLLLAGKEIELGEREAISDVARVLSRYVDAIVIRALSHKMLKELAAYALVPVINGLTRTSHPCQVMADIMTYEERKGPIKEAKITWIGENSNVLTSWIHASARLKCRLCISSPPELTRREPIAWAEKEGLSIELTEDPAKAVANADCIIVDGLSLGDIDTDRRQLLLKNYQVNAKLMKHAKPEALFMHCLPAHRGDEVTDDVLDGPHSVVFDEAENRLHAQKAILAWCFEAF